MDSKFKTVYEVDVKTLDLDNTGFLDSATPKNHFIVDNGTTFVITLCGKVLNSDWPHYIEKTEKDHCMTCERRLSKYENDGKPIRIRLDGMLIG